MSSHQLCEQTTTLLLSYLLKGADELLLAQGHVMDGSYHPARGGEKQQAGINAGFACVRHQNDLHPRRDLPLLQHLWGGEGSRAQFPNDTSEETPLCQDEGPWLTLKLRSVLAREGARSFSTQPTMAPSITTG